MLRCGRVQSGGSVVFRSDGVEGTVLMAGRSPRNPIRELVSVALDLRLQGVPARAIAGAVAEEARRRRLGEASVQSNCEGVAVVFKTGERIDWDGAAWAFVPPVRRR